MLRMMGVFLFFFFPRYTKLKDDAMQSITMATTDRCLLYFASHSLFLPSVVAMQTLPADTFEIGRRRCETSQG